LLEVFVLNESRNVATGKVHPLVEHPERWHSHDEVSTEAEVMDLLWGFVRALQPELALETGTWHGHTSRRIAEALAQNGHGHLFTLEVQEGVARAAQEALRGLPVTVVNESSLTWKPPEGAWFGFAFFDSDPKSNYPLEFRRYRSFMTPGAVVAFHDTANWNCRPPITELETEGLVKAIDLVTPRGITIGVVP
jgi:predicted O-methyltransferase YrrM